MNDYWKMFLAVLPSLPGVARELSGALERDEIPEEVAREVRKALKETSDSEVEKERFKKLLKP